MHPFTGNKDGKDVDELIEEAERVILVRNQPTEDQ